MKGSALGSRRDNDHGYIFIRVGSAARRSKVTGGRPRARDWRLEHHVVVERALGRPLKDGEEVHHVDENKTNNVNDNLAVLQSSADHVELHRKMRVRAAGGDPWRDRLCCTCGPRPATEFYRTASTRVKTGQQWATECKSCGRRRSLARYYRHIRQCTA